MSDLRSKVIRLAYTNPEFRSFLLPLVHRNEVKVSSYQDYMDNKKEYQRVYDKFSRNLKRLGFDLGYPDSYDVHSYGRTEIYWLYYDGTTKIKIVVKTPSKMEFMDDMKNPWDVFYTVAVGHVREDYDVFKPKNLQSLKGAFDKVLKAVTPWI